MDLVFVALPDLRNATLRSGQRVTARQSHALQGACQPSCAAAWSRSAKPTPSRKEKSAWKPCRQSFGSGLTLPEAETTGSSGRAPLLAPSPLRTGLEGFPSSGSSTQKRPREVVSDNPLCLHSLLPYPRTGSG